MFAEHRRLWHSCTPNWKLTYSVYQLHEYFFLIMILCEQMHLFTLLFLYFINEFSLPLIAHWDNNECNSHTSRRI